MPTDREQLLQAFERGELIRPSDASMCFVDVVRAAAHASGVSLALNAHSRALAAHLRGVDHLVFLLADGLGIDLVDRMPRKAWLRRHTLRAIHAPFPSTTTTAVTSFATAEHLATHAVAGWWVHLPEIASTATVFQHDRAVDGVSLDDLGVDAGTISPLPSILPRMDRRVSLVVPEGIVDSAYTRRMSGPCERVGYRSLEGAVDIIVKAAQASTRPTFTYWYTASPDAEEHDHGLEGARVQRATDRLEQALTALETGLEEVGGGTWRIVGTADHGHRDLDPKLELPEHDPLLDCLSAPPSGDMRVQYWHVRPDALEAFARTFRDRFGRAFFLLTAAEVEALRLFGPEAWSDEMHRRAGAYISIARAGASLRYAGIPGMGGYQRMRSGHSGLSPAEMRVPLIIAGEHAPAQDYGG